MRTIKYIKSDLARICNVSTPTFLRWYFFSQGSTFKHDVWFRILQATKKRKITKYTVGIIAYFFEQHYTYKYGIHANSNMEVGYGLKIVHGDGVHLNCKSIGNNFTVYQGVTLGKDKSGIPTIQDDVTIYPGAVVVGGILVHSGAVIGANSFVNHDVPENTVVAGAPAKIIRKIDKHLETITNL